MTDPTNPLNGIIDNLHAAFVGEPTEQQGEPVNFAGEPDMTAPERAHPTSLCEGILLAVLEGHYTRTSIAAHAKIDRKHIAAAIADCDLVQVFAGDTNELGNPRHVATPKGIKVAEERGWDTAGEPLPEPPADTPRLDGTVGSQADMQELPAVAAPEQPAEPAPAPRQIGKATWNGLPMKEARDIAASIADNAGMLPDWIADVVSTSFPEALVHGRATAVKQAITHCSSVGALRGALDRELRQPRVRKGNVATIVARLAALVSTEPTTERAGERVEQERQARRAREIVRERAERVVTVPAVAGDAAAAKDAAPVPAGAALASAQQDAATAADGLAQAVTEIGNLTKQVATLTAACAAKDSALQERDAVIQKVANDAAILRSQIVRLQDRAEAAEQRLSEVEREAITPAPAGDAADATQALLAITAQLIDRIAAK